MNKDADSPVANTCTPPMVLKTEEEYRSALAELSKMFDSDIENEKAFLDLAEVVEAYEKEHYPIPEPDEY